MTDFIAAIELGSSKIAGVAGKKGSDGSIQILAYVREDSAAFVRKGIIFNLDKAAQALTSIINKLESELNCTIGKVYVGISGQSMHTSRNTVIRDFKEEIIVSKEMVDEINDENRAYPLVDREILDVAPQEYKIGINLQAEPVGVAGNRIEGRFLNIIARNSLKKNLERSFAQANIVIADILVAPIAAANVILSGSEHRSGCALVDFGADTTTVAIFKNSILRFLTVIPLGGNNITHDITTQQMEEEEAEQLKREYGNVLFADETDGEETAPIHLSDGKALDPQVLNDIITARAEEIIANVLNQIELSGYEDKLLSGIVLTGGGVNLRNIEELFRKKSKIKKIRTARFIRNEVHSTKANLQKDGTENTLLGLLSAGEENCCQPKAKPEEIKTERVDEYDSPRTSLFDGDKTLEDQEAEARRQKEERDRLKKLWKEEEKKRKEEERRKKREEDKNKPSWFERFFSQDDDLD